MDSFLYTITEESMRETQALLLSSFCH